MSELRATPLSSLRSTGIPFLGDIAWGTHLCVFYETADDLLDATVPYLKAGLESNEFCVWAVSEPLTESDAKNALRDSVRNFEGRMAAGQIEIVQSRDWYFSGDTFDAQRLIAGWHDKLDEALAKRYEGMRATGNAFWLQTNLWNDFCAYEEELDRMFANRNMVAMCTYPLAQSRANDMLDVAHAHSFTVARRSGAWEFLETPELRQAKREIQRLKGALDILSHSFPGSESITDRERMVLAQLVRGATSKEAGRELNISPRTVEFHRANIIKKLGAKNLVELVHKVSSDAL